MIASRFRDQGIVRIPIWALRCPKIPTANNDNLADRAGLSPIASAPSALSASGAERSEEYGSWLSTPTTTGGTPSAQQPDDAAETSAEVRRDFG